MKKNNILPLVLLLAVLGAGVLASSRLQPLTAFVLKPAAAGNAVEAFRIRLFWGGEEPAVESIPVDPKQSKEAVGVLAQKDPALLREFSRNFGTYPIVIGMAAAEDGWPWYLGGGIRNLFHEGPGVVFDDLQWPDRLYLCLATQAPPPAPFSNAPIQVDLGRTGAPAGTANPSAAAAGVVRVEILNGCGITNAADWVARRIKSPQLTITDTTNADNFRYPRTLVRTTVGVPVALEEALDRLGIPKESVEETTSLPSAVDVVVVVGRDFRKLKERYRERGHH